MRCAREHNAEKEMIIYFVLFSVLICACLAQRTYVLGDSLTVGMKSRLSLLIGADLAGYEATVGDTTSAATSKCSFGPGCFGLLLVFILS